MTEDHTDRRIEANSEVLQTEFQYDFWKGPREISASAVFMVFICAVNTVPAEIP